LPGGTGNHSRSKDIEGKAKQPSLTGMDYARRLRVQ
jgi:hypothetical protein